MYQKSATVKTNANDSGTWWITGYYALKFKTVVTVILPHKTNLIGPFVIKRDTRKKVLMNPKYLLQKVELSFQLDLNEIQSECAHTILKGWNKWVKDNISQKPTGRNRRDTIAKILWGIGMGLCVINIVDQEVLANKLETLGKDLSSLSLSLTISLDKLATIQFKVPSILPELWDAQEEDSMHMIDALVRLQSNVSIALSYMKAQIWLVTVAKDLIWDGLNGFCPCK